MDEELKRLGLKVRPRPNGTAEKRPGKIAFDDRGNALFQWDSDVLDEDSAAGQQLREKALACPGLALVEDEDPRNAPIRSNPHGTSVGYNPYESGLLTRRERAPKRDLRELSRWIELKRMVEKAQAEE